MSAYSRPPLSLSPNASGSSKFGGARTGGQSIAQGGAMSAIRSSAKYAAPTTTTNPALTSTPQKSTTVGQTALSRSAGMPSKNSPSASATSAEPQQPAEPPTSNPRGTGGASSNLHRELFPATSSPVFNSTQPVSRSTAFQRSAGASALQNKFGLPTSGGLHALPTANMSLDSATFGSLLHTRDSKFLIAPFRMLPAMSNQQHPTGGSEMMQMMIGTSSRSETPGAVPTLTADSPLRKDGNHAFPPAGAPICYYTIVFDLDETLCCNRGPGKAILRPGAIDMLKSLRALSSAHRPVEIILWTASVESLARQVLQRLDPDESIFTDYVFRDKRWFKETGYTKDLRLLGRDMEHVVIIENSPMSVTLNRPQAILVKDFLGHAPHDSDLKVVREVLEEWVAAETFVPIREWLAQHPKIDRNNHVITAPAVSAIVNVHRTGALGGNLNAGPLRKPSLGGGAPMRASAIPVFAGRRW